MEQSPFQEPRVTQLVKKFPAFYAIQRFITVLTRACHWSLSWARCIQSTPPLFPKDQTLSKSTNYWCTALL